MACLASAKSMLYNKAVDVVVLVVVLSLAVEV